MADARLAEAQQLIEDFKMVIKAQQSGSEVQLDVILDSYLHTRRELAKVVALLAQSQLAASSTTMQRSLNNIVVHLRQILGRHVDPTHIKMRGYRGVHGILLQYLLDHIGRNVPASRLRAFVGDQVHTERRVRELRDLGYDIRASKVYGENHYIVASAEQNVSRAANLLARRIIEKHSADLTDAELKIVEEFVLLNSPDA